uniref:Uncharacterized protein n=1 Tax=Glossina austeni TaxID=7395 RepID=A0A1A9V8E8_GLOAU
MTSEALNATFISRISLMWCSPISTCGTALLKPYTLMLFNAEGLSLLSLKIFGGISKLERRRLKHILIFRCLHSQRANSDISVKIFIHPTTNRYYQPIQRVLEVNNM